LKNPNILFYSWGDPANLRSRELRSRKERNMSVILRHLSLSAKFGYVYLYMS